MSLALDVTSTNVLLSGRKNSEYLVWSNDCCLDDYRENRRPLFGISLKLYAQLFLYSALDIERPQIGCLLYLIILVQSFLNARNFGEISCLNLRYL